MHGFLFKILNEFGLMRTITDENLEEYVEKTKAMFTTLYGNHTDDLNEASYSIHTINKSTYKVTTQQGIWNFIFP